ncbi:hypothetical protein [Kosakonia sacchari]|uniref:hypothetical protein n=1 Tax=Kosakonia sacchari TaxID=1158459 RepID=UPI001141BA0F|nr:hypothetical protein [Kosakonia sacchari]
MKQKAKPLHIISDRDVADCGGGQVMDVKVGGIIGGTCIYCFYFYYIKQFVKLLFCSYYRTTFPFKINELRFIDFALSDPAFFRVEHARRNATSRHIIPRFIVDTSSMTITTGWIK